MRKSIFEIENRLDINTEFERLFDSLCEKETIYYNYSSYSYFQFVNEYIFNRWEYRDTFVDLHEYLEFLGLNESIQCGHTNIKEKEFLNFLEFLLNIMYCMEINNKNLGFSYNNIKVKNIIFHNIPLILEKMNYKVSKDNDKFCIIKRDEDVDSILEIVPENISQLLLSYNDIRNNNKDSKVAILKGIDLYLETGDNKKKFKSIDSNLVDSIGTIVNKMGVNHPINEEPYLSLGEKSILEWYDKCFKMMIHLIRSKDVAEIKKQRTELIQKEGK